MLGIVFNLSYFSGTVYAERPRDNSPFSELPQDFHQHQRAEELQIAVS